MSLLPQRQVALIVGGTSGIGLAAARRFVAEGFHVVVAARNVEQGQHAERELNTPGAETIFHVGDASDPASVAALVQFVVERYGRLDCAVNCAAVETRPQAMHETACDTAAALVDTDILGVFHCMKYEIDAMLSHGAGTIVNLSSVNGLSGTPSAAMYSAGRHAVIGMTRSAAKEYIGRGIRINAVCPGATDTPRREKRTAHLTPDQLSAAQAELAQAIPIGRMASSEEIANAIFWLSSPESAYVVGHSLVVDGGLAA